MCTVHGSRPLVVCVVFKRANIALLPLQAQLQLVLAHTGQEHQGSLESVPSRQLQKYAKSARPTRPSKKVQNSGTLWWCSAVFTPLAIIASIFAGGTLPITTTASGPPPPFGSWGMTMMGRFARRAGGRQAVVVSW